MKCTAYSRAERSSPADGVSSCKQSPRLSLSSAAPLKNTTWSCFFNVCKVFCTHLHNFFEIVRGACRLRSAIENTSCSHRLLLPSELSRQTSRRYGVPFFVCVPHTTAKTLLAGSSAAFEASSCQQFQPLHLPSAARFILS